MMRLIEIKQDFPSLDLVIFGGSEAASVAHELAEADIPVILTANRGAPVAFETKDVLIGPPLTPSSASVLAEANVTFGLAIESVGAYTLTALSDKTNTNGKQKETQSFITYPRKQAGQRNMRDCPIRLL